MQTENTATISPDGQWIWNGVEWVPNTAATQLADDVAPVAANTKKKHLGLKIAGGALAVLIVAAMASGGGDTGATSSEASGSQDTVEAPAQPEAAAPAAPAPAPAPEVAETVAQKNAVRSAESYLKFTAFSRDGLIGQLEFEGYSTADATYAVDAINPDWNEQAAKSAKSYLEFSSFSRSGLIDQLEFEGFTNEQAVYGVNSVGL